MRELLIHLVVIALFAGLGILFFEGKGAYLLAIGGGLICAKTGHRFQIGREP